MNYEEKYKKALEIANAKIETYYHLGNTSVAKSIEEIFPELKESEDERIRKNIKVALMSMSDNLADFYSTHHTSEKELLAWLEKQGEKKPIISDDAVREGIVHFGITQYQITNWLKKYIDVKEQGEQSYYNGEVNDEALQQQFQIWFDKGKCSGRDEVIFHPENFGLQKQGEQKPTDKVEPKFKVGDIIRYKNSGAVFTIKSVFPDHYSLANNEGLLYFMFQDKYKLVEQKPAWSEEDEPQKELAEIYLAVFDEKFPILPTLKGKQLADYKNFLNKCQQILGLKYWSLRPLQAKLFEKLSLLWATWGAEHLQIGQAHGEFDTPKVKETMILE